MCYLERALHEDSGCLLFNHSSETNLLCDLINSFLPLYLRGITWVTRWSLNLPPYCNQSISKVICLSLSSLISLGIWYVRSFWLHKIICL